MQALLLKLAQVLLPILLDWLYKKISAHAAKVKAKNEKDLQRGVNNEKNLKKLQECTDLECKISAMRDVYNGAPSVQDGPEVS